MPKIDKIRWYHEWMNQIKSNQQIKSQKFNSVASIHYKRLPNRAKAGKKNHRISLSPFMPGSALNWIWEEKLRKRSKKKV